MPTIGISGAPVGNVLCFGLCMVLDLVVIARVIHGRPDYLPLLAKPAAAAGVMEMCIRDSRGDRAPRGDL